MYRKNILTLLVFISLFVVDISAQKHTISGYIYDSKTSEKLINATTYDQISKKGAVSNNYGFYSITLTKGKVNMLYSYVGYQPVISEFNLYHDTLINIPLNPSTELGEVVVIASKAEKAVKSTQLSTISIPVKQIQMLPVFLGEPDVIKALQLLPGVQSGSEGASGLYVRGGGPDQNLILLDGVPVYNVNHLFGFFSVFNPSSLSNVTLYKGSYPARYGGRLSSVLDIRMKEGNMQEFHGEASIGVISSKFSVEGPLIKDRMSFIISARRTYIDYLMRPLIKYASEGNVFGYYFYDLNGKINLKLNDKHHIYLSAYTGRDEFYANIEDDYRSEGITQTNTLNASIWWGNLTTAFRWNYMISPQLFSNTTLTYSTYNYVTSLSQNFMESGTENRVGMGYNSGIFDLAAKVDFDWNPLPEHNIKFGANYTKHAFNPGISSLQIKFSELLDTTFNTINQEIHANEMYGYFEDNFEITKKLKVNFGLHASMFQVESKNYFSLEPRISARYLINDNLSVKAAYTRMTQYIHLLSNSSIGLPTDLWVPVTKDVKPQRANQYNAGVFYKINKDIDISLEGFYKHMNNAIDYLAGASYMYTQHWDENVASTEGWAYGGEILLRKSLGKTTGWIGYTLAWSNRQAPEINFGEIYPVKYDRRHDISVVLMHKFNERVDVGATWVYGTGYAMTLENQNYITNPVFDAAYATVYYDSNKHYGGRNNYRMPAYHRLDLGVNFHKQRKYFKRTLSFSVYNAYHRANPFMVYAGYSDSNGYEDSKRSLKQISIFPILPSVSYKITF